MPNHEVQEKIKRTHPKVLHILNGFGFGGAETWLLEIVKLNRGNYPMDFLLTGGETQALDSEFELLGCKLYYVRYSGKNPFPFIREFRRVVKEGGYNVIHDHEDFMAGWHWLFLSGIWPQIRIAHAHNSVLYVQNYLRTRGRRIIYHFGRFLSGLLSTGITGTSNKLMEELKYGKSRYLKKRIAPLYCGSKPELFAFNAKNRCDIRQEFGFSDTDKVVLFIGRIGLMDTKFKNPKNPEFAFKLAMEVVAKRSDYKFLFVGNKGDTGTRFEEEACKKGLSNSIYFTDLRSDVPSLISGADLMLFTSTTEPFGLILTEAQFSGLPVLASNIITPEVVSFPELIQLKSLDDDEESWVREIIVLGDCKFDRSAFCEAHHNEILNSPFSIENSYRRLIKNYTGVPT